MSAPPAPARRQGLPRSSRIRARADFVRIQTGERGCVARAHAPHFLLLAAPRGDGRRLGIVASRKVGNAVLRNRAKRLVREACRTMNESLLPHADLVVIVRPGAAELGYARTVNELEHALRKLARALAQLASRGPSGHTSPGEKA